MPAIFRIFGVLLLPLMAALPVGAAELEASLDQYETTLEMNVPTVLQATLRNEGPNPLYLTGVKVRLSEGASGDVYNPAILQQRLFRLEPGHSWGGPLAVIRPHHRGPLLVKGNILLLGGQGPDASDLLASIPLRITIDDPKRQLDGSSERGALPACDRDLDHCCDPAEINCFSIAERCIYIAEGYGRQQICVNERAERTHERISDVKISTSGAHLAYIAGDQCASAAGEERCRRAVIVDQAERPGPGVPTHLDLSPDGQHYSYIERTACGFFSGEEKCTGPSHKVVDGLRQDQR